MEKIVSQLDDQGYFVGPVLADPDRLEPGNYLMPSGSVDLPPPDVEDGKRYRAVSGGWSVEDIPKEPEPEAPPEPTLDEQRAAKLAEINAAYTLATSTLRHGYPNTERESWPVQIMESAAVIAGADVDTPWIDAAADARGITPMELAEKIRDMDVAYRQYHGGLTGKRQAMAEQVAAADADGLAAIVWDAA